MTHGLGTANLDRAAEHAGLLGVVFAIAAVGGVVCGLVRPLVGRRPGRTRSGREPDGARGRGARDPRRVA